MTPLEDLLLHFFASVTDREKGADYIQRNPEEFGALFTLACSKNDDRKHIVAAWILEKYTLSRLEVLAPILGKFLTGVALQTHESKRRPMIKLLYHYCRKKERRKELHEHQIDQIVQICFDYMLEANKIAAIAFAMKTLYFFRFHQEWIDIELQAYIDQRLPNSSKSFKALVRQIS